MPYIWSKKHPLNQKAIKSLSRVKSIKNHINHPTLWRLDQKSVARGVAIGLFLSVITVLPFQMIVAAVIAIMIRANLPIAIGMTWICNPITIIPITYLNYYVGSWILGEKSVTMMLPHNSWSLYSYAELWTLLTAGFFQLGKAFFMGVTIVAIMAAMIGYFIVILIWRIKQSLSKEQKK